MRKFTVGDDPIKHDGTMYMPGDTIELPAERGEQLGLQPFKEKKDGNQLKTQLAQNSGKTGKQTGGFLAGIFGGKETKAEKRQIEAVVEAIASLTPEDFDESGAPRAEALSIILAREVTPETCAEAWAAYQTQAREAEG